MDPALIHAFARARAIHMDAFASGIDIRVGSQFDILPTFQLAMAGVPRNVL